MLIQLVIAQIVTFVAIVFVLKRLLYSESAKETLRLRKLKEETALKQKELQQKIEAAQTAYRERMSEAEEKARALIIKSEEETEALRKRVLEKAKDDAENVVKSALNAKEKMREEIFVEIWKKVPALASRVFKEVLSPEVQEMVHKEQVRDVVEKLKKIDKAAFKSKVERGDIISAYPLSKSEKAEVESLIRLGVGYAVPTHETEDRKLVAGVIIKLGTIMIDGSLDNRLKQVELRRDRA